MRHQKLQLNALLFSSLVLFASLFPGRAFAQPDVIANTLVSNTSDFQDPQHIVDADLSNYAYLSNLLGLLSSSSVRVRLPQTMSAGDVINVAVSGTGQTLGVDLLNNVVIKLYDDAGNLVAASNVGGNTLKLNLLVGGTNLYDLRFITNQLDTFKFREISFEVNDLLSVNLGSELRVYDIYVHTPCPAVYADSVYLYSNGITASVDNPQNAVDSDPNDYARPNVTLALLGLTPSAILDLSFSELGRAGDYVGFTIAPGTGLLSVAVLPYVTISAYDQNNVLVSAASTFTLADLKLLPGSVDKYLIGFQTVAGTYRIARVRITLDGGSVIGLLQDLKVYNGFHYNIDAPPITIIADGPTAICDHGCSVTLTAIDSISGATYLWNTGQTTQSITVSQPGDYSVTAMDSVYCPRTSAIVSVTYSNDTNGTMGDNIIIHDVITPNNDGVNDKMVIEGIGSYPNNEIRIFNRLGDVVFTQSHYENTWRGTYPNGDELPAGTYYYLLNLNSNNLQHGAKSSYTGAILIQR